jgi:ethanolamine utilization cobalamin adenosyltransferase
MANSISKELKFVKNLINKGKLEEALHHIEKIDKKEILDNEEVLRTQSYKARIYLYLGHLEGSSPNSGFIFNLLSL